MLTFRALGALLAYPGRELIDALPEIAGVLESSRLLGTAQKQRLADLVSELRRADSYELEERYVALFDRGRATSLHLFEHVHGDSRDRGQAMVDLKAMYHRAGFELATNELPDFLPAVLEYLSTRPADEVHEVLDDCVHILRAVGERLHDGGSPYAAAFSALLDLHGETPLVAGRSTGAVGRPLDDDWQEAPVEFGPNAVPHGTQQSPARGQFIRFVPKRHVPNP